MKRRSPILKTHCEHLLDAGKRKKVALVACMRKLLTMLNVIAKHGTKWVRRCVTLDGQGGCSGLFAVGCFQRARPSDTTMKTPPIDSNALRRACCSCEFQIINLDSFGSVSTLKKDPTCTPARMAIEALTRLASNGSAGGWDTIAFGNPNVPDVAASGDFGNKPMWPAVSNKVLVVGGTRAIGPVDTDWSLSGGGLSAFYEPPTWQRAAGPRRAVPDLSMVADSASPVSVYITPSPPQPDSACVAKRGAAACGWYMGDRTSVGALMVAGNNGYPAAKGFDLVTGLGTPVADRLVSLLARH